MAIASTILPDHDEILRRLSVVDDGAHPVRNLYPHIASRIANSEVTGPGVVLALRLVLADYTAGMPPMLAYIAQSQESNYIRAIVDDQVVLADAIAMLDRVNGREQRGASGV